MDLKKGIRLYLKALPVLNKESEISDSVGGEDSGKKYEFYIGPLDHVPEKDKIYLHITEMTHRDAEGRPVYKEQEKWINTVLKLKRIKAVDYWWSHWQFDSEKHAENFIQVLIKFNACEKE